MTTRTLDAELLLERVEARAKQLIKCNAVSESYVAGVRYVVDLIKADIQSAPVADAPADGTGSTCDGELLAVAKQVMQECGCYCNGPDAMDRRRVPCVYCAAKAAIANHERTKNADKTTDTDS
jgi:hypothetical protein